MKAYVIKRDDGKYLDGMLGWTESVIYCRLFEDKQIAQCILKSLSHRKESKVVSIEINEIQEQAQ